MSRHTEIGLSEGADSGQAINAKVPVSGTVGMVGDNANLIREIFQPLRIVEDPFVCIALINP
jgi:hypothetical protein